MEDALIAEFFWIWISIFLFVATLGHGEPQHNDANASLIRTHLQWGQIQVSPPMRYQRGRKSIVFAFQFRIRCYMSAPPKPPTFWNSYTRTLILDTIMKLSGTIGVTQKTMTLDTHVRLILLQTLNPQERWGTHKKRWPFQPRLFADVIGLVRCSYDEMMWLVFFKTWL